EDVTLPLDEGTAATNVLGAETATRRLDQTERTEWRPASPSRRPAPRAPQPAAAPRPPAAPPPPRKRSPFSRFSRFVLAAVALVLIAAAVAAAVILATDKATGVHATEVAGDSVDKVVEEVKDLVKKNTE